MSDYIKHTKITYKTLCHKMAGNVQFYPFDEKTFINIGELFENEPVQPKYFAVNARIERISSLWKLCFGYGKYKVSVFGADHNKKKFFNSYVKKVRLFWIQKFY